MRFISPNGQPGSYQLARWVSTDKRACGYLEGWPPGFPAKRNHACSRLVLRLARRNGSVRCGRVCSKIVYSVRIGPLQPKFLLFQQLPQTLQPSEFVSKAAVLNSLTSPSSERTYDHAITGHSVWSTAFIRSSFIRPPCTSMLERAVSISRRSAGVS